MRFQFTDDYLTGNPTINNEHRHLFEILNNVCEAMGNEKIKKPELLREFLEELGGYAIQHFVHEEKFMDSINDPQLNIQKKEHMAFVNYVEEQKELEITEENAAARLDEVIDFGAKWLSQHILGSDVLIGAYSEQADADASFSDDPFAFTDKYLTGIEQVDKEHERLFEIIAEINDSLNSMGDYDRFDSIMEILGELKEYTIVHFSHEEEYMKSINYEGLDEQIRLHKTFVERLSSVNVDYIDDNQKGYLEDLIRFLLNWLSTHILLIDKRIPKK